MVRPTRKRRRAPLMPVLLWVMGVCLFFLLLMQAMYGQPTRLHRAAAPKALPANEVKGTLSMCSTPVPRRSDYAVVALMPTGFPPANARVLGRSLARATSLDFVLLSEQMVAVEGWVTCVVAPMAVGGTKLRAWNLVEYKAVLLLDMDTLALTDPLPLFTEHYPLMLQQNASVGGVSLRVCRSQRIRPQVLLLIPSQLWYLRLRKQLFRWPAAGFGGTIKAVFGNSSFYELPAIYNADAAWKHCNPRWWKEAKVSIVHFSIAKPWSLLSNDLLNLGSSHPLACWITGLSELCKVWLHYYY
jgi:hypothetical protein